ncbi:EAL domain-containing protein [Meiothermus sp. PNK-Is4]|nr:diguanylate cyclase [Meiothermus sp. Pnk-1]RYM36589.1 EAL domain-containing protein [Meiothermus sp. PNK-Is4]
MDPGVSRPAAHLSLPCEVTHSIFVVRTDLEGRITYANRAYLSYMGWEQPPLGADALEQVEPDERPRVLEAVRQALSRPGQPVWLEFGKPRAATAWSRSRWEFVVVCDALGQPAEVQCTGYDISDAYRQERFREEVTALLARALQQETSPAALLRRALAAAMGTVPVAQAGSVTLKGPDGRFHFVAAQGYDLAALSKVSLDPSEPLSLSRHIRARVFGPADLASFNARLDPKRREILETAGCSNRIQAMLSVPVVVAGEPRAYLYLDHFERSDAFDALDMQHLEALAYYVALMLQESDLQRQLLHLRYHDPQTGLANLRLLLERLGRRLATRRRQDATHLALLAVRIPALERLQELYGPLGGITAIQTAARRILEAIRSDDLLAWDLRQFWLLLGGLARPEDVWPIVERLRQALSSPLLPGWEGYASTPMLGVALAAPESNPEDLLQQAEAAVSQASRPGTVVFFDPALREALQEERWLNEALRQAISLRRLVLYFQPVVELSSRRLLHLEALLRWPHPERGFIPPALFIPLAERQGWMGELGDWVIAEAARKAAGWGIPVAVNLSASQLTPALPQAIAARCREAGIGPEGLILEITESQALEPAALEVLQALAEEGYALHLDDFGSGYSSLEQITRLPIRAVKLGQGFLSSLGKDPRPESPPARVLTAVKGMGEGLGLEVIVEGIETKAQHRYLLAQGFRFGQGYLLGRPVEARFIARRLRQRG